MDLTTRVSLLLLLLGFLSNHYIGAKQRFLILTIAQKVILSCIFIGSTEFLVEGDILLPKNRNTTKCPNKNYSCRCPKSPTSGNVDVPYVLSDKYGGFNCGKTILEAMKGFETATCVRFVPRTAEEAYLSTEPRYGCFSLVGRIGDKQVVSLQRFGCVQHGIIQHELLHHIRVNWQNIIKDYYIDFYKKDSYNLNTKYDYSSVMTAFGITPESETLTPIPNPNVPIGQIVGMSDIDILRVNILYQCQN
uniref:Metalloendopeptidase n=1 Tax=Oreochromis niloticus TaxID=8128 RepID=A0A669F8R1_ORENI